MAETCKLGGEVTNKMLGVGRGQKRIVKLARERFKCWPLSWKQSTLVLFGWREFEPSPHSMLGLDYFYFLSSLRNFDPFCMTL